MKLPKNYFENLSTYKYRQYLKLLPDVKKENTKAVTMLIFTFFAMSFLGIFAINPTLSTIVDLHKQLEDSKFVYEKLTTKINNLASLQTQYESLTDDVPVVMDAIPASPAVTVLVGQIEAIARQNGTAIKTINVEEVKLSKIVRPNKNSLSFTFAIEAEGDYDTLIRFAESLTNFNRVIVLEHVSLSSNSRNSTLLLLIKGRGYFKQ